MEWVGDSLTPWLTNILIQGHFHHEPYRPQATHIFIYFGRLMQITWNLGLSLSKHTKRNKNSIIIIIGGALSSAKLWSFVAFKFIMGNLKSKVRTQFASYAPSNFIRVISSMLLCIQLFFFFLLLGKYYVYFLQI